VTLAKLNSPDFKEKDMQNHYRKLMQKNHPDSGGSPYISTKINEARDLLSK